MLTAESAWRTSVLSMTELQNLLKSFLGGEIGLDELTQQFASMLEDDSELPMSAVAWIDDGEQDGRLSSTVCRSLKGVLESHLAAAYADPDPEFSDIFAAPGTGDGQPVEPPAEKQAQVQSTIVIEAGSTAMGSRSIGIEAETQVEQITQIRSTETDVRILAAVAWARYSRPVTCCAPRPRTANRMSR
jgi:hypothetical protein